MGEPENGCLTSDVDVLEWNQLRGWRAEQRTEGAVLLGSDTELAEGLMAFDFNDALSEVQERWLAAGKVTVNLFGHLVAAVGQDGPMMEV